MSNRDLEKSLEDQFIQWQLQLSGDQQDAVRYDDYDRTLHTLFLRRTPDFEVSQKDDLEKMLQRYVDQDLRVSTIRVPHFY